MEMWEVFPIKLHMRLFIVFLHGWRPPVWIKSNIIRSAIKPWLFILSLCKCLSRIVQANSGNYISLFLLSNLICLRLSRGILNPSLVLIHRSWKVQEETLKFGPDQKVSFYVFSYCLLLYRLYLKCFPLILCL